MSDDVLSYIHRYVPPQDPAERRTLLLLHGTGGDENDLLGLGRHLLPGAGLLSPRGNVPEGGMNRFFRRLDVGVFDQDDLRRRTDDLAAFLQEAAERYQFDGRKVFAVGYSNGANIAASVLLRHPQALSGAVLFHAQLPFVPDGAPDLAGRSVFIGAGMYDPLVPKAGTEQLAELLRSYGAQVTLHFHTGGHELLDDEVEAARSFLVL